MANQLIDRRKHVKKVPRDFNNTIRKIAKDTGLNRLCPRFEQHGTRKTGTNVPLYEMISSHTARRTFITMLALRGWNARKIMDYSGHRKIEMVERYSKTTPAEHRLFKDLPIEQRLKMVDEVPAMPVQASNNMSFDVNYIEHKVKQQLELEHIKECHNLLYYLGVPQKEYIDLQTVSELHRIFYIHEDELVKQGISVEVIKGLYNSKEKGLTEKREALLKLLAESDACEARITNQ